MIPFFLSSCHRFLSSTSLSPSHIDHSSLSLLPSDTLLFISLNVAVRQKFTSYSLLLVVFYEMTFLSLIEHSFFNFRAYFNDFMFWWFCYAFSQNVSSDSMCPWSHSDLLYSCLKLYLCSQILLLLFFLALFPTSAPGFCCLHLDILLGWTVTTLSKSPANRIQPGTDHSRNRGGSLHRLPPTNVIHRKVDIWMKTICMEQRGDCMLQK